MKILIADDDPISRRMMEKMLTQSGYEVVTVADGRAALQVLSAKNAPRLALLDWMMPELDGPEVCRQVRLRHDEMYVYITLLTSKQSAGDIVTGLEAGSDDYLTKPCNPEELKARLRTGQRILQLEDKLVEAREEMRTRATIDPLTGVWNRGAVLSLLKSEITRCRRENKPLSLLLCDVDHFKRVNDTHGHLVGDEVLREVGNRLQNAVRPYDAVGRYGGEEFVVIFSGCDADQLNLCSEQVLESFRSKPFETNAGTLTVTASAGGITMESLDWGGNVEYLLSRADTALYRAKMDGRNCVRYAAQLALGEEDGVGLPTVS